MTAKISLPNDRFGWNLDLSNGVAVISTPNYNGRGMNSGAVFVQELNNEAK
ncbi:hypothetical protein J7384_07920 [Endozoicomonas sp. G2_1]|nr:hypothetical protein [Endozoicomonas sp. G2_1]